MTRAIAAAGTASQSANYGFCHDAEGWGPLSLVRYDFTPCFVNVPLAAVATFGIFAGGITLWYLITKASKQPTQKDWHYYTKLVGSTRMNINH